MISDLKFNCYYNIQEDSMNLLMEFITKASDLMWSSVLLVVLVAVGVIYTVYLKFPQFTHLGAAFKQAFGEIFSSRKEAGTSSMSSFQALATSIAAQIGTGNVAGVATAIMSGGPGAIFWMWVSALMGMGTIFGEAVLAQKYRELRDGQYVGGPAFYISKGLKNKKLGKFMSTFFSVAIIIALGFVGNMVQSNSITVAVNNATGVNPLIIGVALGLVAALVFMGGMKRIASFAELVVPFMALLYILGGLVVLFLFKENIIPAFVSIFEGAFNPQAVMGGAAGVTIKQAVRYGVARGLFSNEAGMGSTPHAHAVANVKHPAQQGLVAMVGVVIDTIIVCTATALIVLVTKANLVPGLAGPLVTQQAFTTAFGTFGTSFLALTLTFFAFTTIVGWYYFGETNVRYLFGHKGVRPYQLVVVAFVIMGAMLSNDVNFVWTLADFFNGIMVFPNLIALLILAPQVKKLLVGYDNGEVYTPDVMK